MPCSASALHAEEGLETALIQLGADDAKSAGDAGGTAAEILLLRHVVKVDPAILTLHGALAAKHHAVLLRIQGVKRVDEKWRGKFQYTALAVNYEKEALPAGSQGTERKKSKRQSRLELSDGDMIQQTLPLSENEFSRGIMEKTTPVRWNGEELDIPTFLRKNQVIDTGKDQLS